MNDLVSYEKSVEIIRSDPEMQSLVRDAYLDHDPKAAWSRFEQSEEWRAVLDLLNLDAHSKGRSILDIGCGNGIASMAFRNAGHAVIAVDPDASVSVGGGAIVGNSNSEVTVIRSFAENLPLASASFDIVYGRQVLHHFSSLVEGLKECARVARPKGKLLFCREHVVDDSASLEEFLNHHPLHKYHGGENAYTVSEYLEAFASAGLKVCSLLGPFDSVINHFPTSNCDVQKWFKAGLCKRFGGVLARFFGNSIWLEKVYRKALSRKCRQPGRLYSFLLERVA